MVVQEEEGCLHYQLYREVGEETAYAMIETWACQEDLTRCQANPTPTVSRHSKSAHVKAFQASQDGNLQATCMARCLQLAYETCNKRDINMMRH